MPENFWDPTTSAVKPEFWDDYAAKATRLAADDLRRAKLPPTVNDYKAELPSDFNLPEGITFDFNESDPHLLQARQVMHEVDQGRLSGQEAFSKFLGIYAGMQGAEKALVERAKTAEVAKAGPNGPAQVTAIHQWLDAMGAPGLKDRVLTAQDIKEFSNLVSRHQSQGAASFSQSHRDTPNPQGKATQEQYDKMTSAQRLDYTRQFDQSQFQKSA